LSTHRTRDPLPARLAPLGPEDFVGKPWPLVRVLSGSAMRAILSVEDDCLIVAGRQQPLTWEDLRGFCQLSFDHGATWQTAEKEVEG
jgi:hypothetical protein